MAKGCSFFAPSGAISACVQHDTHYNLADISKFAADWEFAWRSGLPLWFALPGYLAVSTAGWLWWWYRRVMDARKGNPCTALSLFGFAVKAGRNDG